MYSKKAACFIFDVCKKDSKYLESKKHKSQDKTTQVWFKDLCLSQTWEDNTTTHRTAWIIHSAWNSQSQNLYVFPHQSFSARRTLFSVSARPSPRLIKLTSTQAETDQYFKRALGLKLNEKQKWITQLIFWYQRRTLGILIKTFSSQHKLS